MAIDVTAPNEFAAPVPVARPARIWAWLRALSVGAVGGAALGAVARGWMRLITDEPEFSWNGTLFIVLAFTIAGLGHAVAATSRYCRRRRRWSTFGRTVGAACTLPLFVGAGAMMLPTVAGGSLALWRTDWPRWARVLAALVALPVPVAIIVDNITGDRIVGRVGGLALLTATYAIVIWSVGAVAAPLGDGWRMGRLSRIVSSVVGVTATGAVALLTAGFVLTGD